MAASEHSALVFTNSGRSEIVDTSWSGERGTFFAITLNLGGRERGVVKSLGQPLHRLGGQPQGGNNTVFQYGVIAIIPKIEKDLLYIQN